MRLVKTDDDGLPRLRPLLPAALNDLEIVNALDTIGAKM